MIGLLFGLKNDIGLAERYFFLLTFYFFYVLLMIISIAMQKSM